MGKIAPRIAVIGGAFAAAIAGSAGAGEQGWYLGIEAGAEFDGHFDAQSDTGYAIMATVGHSLGQNFELEGEIGYRSASVTMFAYDVDQFSVMLNAVYEAPLTEQLALNIGGGIGLDVIHASMPSFFFPIDDSSVEFAAQFKAGLTYALSETTDVTATYRYMQAFEGDFTELDNSTLTVGLRFDL
jgi:opacity protein-like surface antigen